MGMSVSVSEGVPAASAGRPFHPLCRVLGLREILLFDPAMRTTRSGSASTSLQRPLRAAGRSAEPAGMTACANPSFSASFNLWAVCATGRTAPDRLTSPK